MSCPGSMGIIAAKQAPVILTGAVGRPAFEISIHQLQYLVENRISVPQIAELLGVSVSSVRRQKCAFNISIRDTYSSITNDQLDEIVSTVQELHPNWGIDKCMVILYPVASGSNSIGYVNHKDVLIHMVP